MCDLVARTGRHQQRYEDGCRLVAGCIPFRYRGFDETCDDKVKAVEVLMINSQSGPGLLFPKVRYSRLCDVACIKK
ncbi:Nudix hydrolase 16, mitochondrial, partial [Ananas comosus]